MSSATPTPTPTRQRQTADALIAAFNRMDIPAILSLRSPTCTRSFSPRSVPHAPQNNDQYARELYRIVTIFRAFHLSVHDVVEDVAARKICMWLTTTAETAVGPYLNEYVWTMEFDESGEKLVAVREFVDSKYSMEFLPKMQEAVRAKRKEEEEKGEKTTTAS